MTAATLLPCPLFIDGAWFRPAVAGTPVYNPSTGDVIAECPAGGAAEVSAAVEAAAAAFPAWRETPAVERARLFFRYRQLVEQNFDRLCQSVCREHGKTLVEARGSVYRGIENIEYACGIPSMLFGDTLENLARNVDCETVLQPLGVCAGITPFNFPAMVPLWMFPLALACGNTFVLKPSEKVPLTAVMMVELLEKAGLPKGVLNLVHGGRETVDALLTHPKVRAISFVGSSPIAKHVYETGTRHGKRVQANGGAKNFIVVMPDADIPKTVEALSTAAFGCAGERCMAGSTALTVGAAAERLLPSLLENARAIKVGPTDRPAQPDMGPVITAQHRDRVSSLVDSGEKEGAQVVCDGRNVRLPETPRGFYFGATVVDRVAPEMKLAREEVFGPVLNVMRMEDLDSAIETANRSAFGNGAAIFTRSGAAAREFKHRVKAGMVGINVGVPATMAMFAFTGWDDSFYGDLHIQGREAVQFYTQQKVITTRWFGGEVGTSGRNSPPAMPLLIKNGEIITADSRGVADIYCESEQITRIGKNLAAPAGAEVIDATGRYVFPGFIDPHVHITLPFMGTHAKDTYETGSRAALMGGTTTLIEMCCPARKDDALAGFEHWRAQAEGKSACDFTFHMGVTRFDDATESQLREIVRRGLSSFKIFLAYKGAFGIDDTELYRTLKLARELGVTVTAHCENETLVAERQKELIAAGRTDPGQHHESRPPLVEAEGVHHLMTFAELTGASTYIVHLSCREALETALAARRRGVKVRIETLIQYLVLDKTYAERPNFEGAKYVMSPPLRDAANQEALWAALRSGSIDTVATDHAPFDFQTQKPMGRGNFTKIPNGIPSLEDRVTLLHSRGVREGKIDLHKLVDAGSTQAARIFDLFPRKGTIQPGSDADLVVFDPRLRGVISAKTHSMNVDYSAFEGWPVEGRPTFVTVRGQVAVKDGKYVGTPGRGRFLARTSGGA